MDTRDTTTFTLVFRGDLREFKDNPLKTETPFGAPIAAGFGNAFHEIEDMHDILEAIGDVEKALAANNSATAEERLSWIPK